MTPFTLATWNINSVRLRAPHVASFVKEANPDVVALQEIKCLPDQFPRAAFEEMGLPHLHIVGQKGLHGVAIASRTPIEVLDQDALCPRGEARFQRVLVNGVELQNYYIPAGGDEPDPEINPRFKHKLDFLDRLKGYAADRAKENAPIVMVGDFNIAPREHDVWSHKQLLKVVSHTPVEVDALNAWMQAGEYIDVARELIDEPEKLFTWWSYRSKDWRASNRGRRLDHIWVSPALKDAALKDGRDSFRIWDEARSWEKPSDHAPVTLRLG